MYISNKRNTASVTKGILSPSDERTWSILAQTEPFPASGINHMVNALLVTLDNRSILVNSGARTDHGEIRDNGGTHSGVRESGLTSIVWRLHDGVREQPRKLLLLE